MSDWHGINFAPQGWQCPVCKRVYSPTTPMCYYCGNSNTIVLKTVYGETIDWLHHDSVNKTEKPEESR